MRRSEVLRRTAARLSRRGRDFFQISSSMSDGFRSLPPWSGRGESLGWLGLVRTSKNAVSKGLPEKLQKYLGRIAADPEFKWRAGTLNPFTAYSAVEIISQSIPVIVGEGDVLICSAAGAHDLNFLLLSEKEKLSRKISVTELSGY